jgi:hypothetical protein
MTKTGTEGSFLFYLLMVVWLVFGILFLIGVIYWLIKKKHGKIILGSLVLSLGSLIAALVIGNEPPTQQAVETGIDAVEGVDNEVIIDAIQFAGISEAQLIELLGEPDSKENWSFTSSTGQNQEAVIFSYGDENTEFIVIGGKVVRFTYYGSGEKYRDGEHALSLFGIKSGPDITVVANTGSAIRYQKVNKSVEEFWVVDDLEEDNTLGTVKITYDLRYF